MFKNDGRQYHDRFSGKKEKSHNNSTRKHKFNRDFSSIAHDYYSQIFPYVKRKTGWQKINCVFHDDRTPSLSISLEHGGFKCFACNVSGDLVKFHMMKNTKTFYEAVNELNAWEY